MRAGCGSGSALLAVCLTLVPLAVRANIIVLQANETIAEYASEAAAFGTNVPLHGLKGWLAVGDPLEACSPLAPAPHNTSVPWLLLVRRGNCTFADKVRAAQLAGYRAVVIFNRNSDDIFPMHGQNTNDVKILAVMVGETAGHALVRYLGGKGYWVKISRTAEPDAADYLIPFVGVCLLCIFILLCFLLQAHRCFLHYRRVRRSRLPPRALEAIPVKKFDKAADPYDTCAICLDDFEQNDQIRVLPCNHAYHAACIDPWLTRSRRVCPICKRSVLENEYSSATEESSSSEEAEHEPLIQQTPNRRAAAAVTAYGATAAVHTAGAATTDSQPTPSGPPRRRGRFRIFRRLRRSRGVAAATAASRGGSTVAAAPAVDTDDEDEPTFDYVQPSTSAAGRDGGVVVVHAGPTGRRRRSAATGPAERTHRTARGATTGTGRGAVAGTARGATGGTTAGGYGRLADRSSSDDADSESSNDVTIDVTGSDDVIIGPTEHVV